MGGDTSPPLPLLANGIGDGFGGGDKYAVFAWGAFDELFYCH